MSGVIAPTKARQRDRTSKQIRRRQQHSKSSTLLPSHDHHSSSLSSSSLSSTSSTASAPASASASATTIRAVKPATNLGIVAYTNKPQNPHHTAHTTHHTSHTYQISAPHAKPPTTPQLITHHSRNDEAR